MRALLVRDDDDLNVKVNEIVYVVMVRSYWALGLVDRLLSLVTWSGDVYGEVVAFVIVEAILWYWNKYLWPLLLVMVLVIGVWQVSIDQQEVSVQECVDLLHNISIKCEAIMDFPVSTRHIWGCLWIYPIEVLICRQIVHWNKFVLLMVLFVWTFHSPWACLARLLLYRSVYIRWLIGMGTGTGSRTHQPTHSHQEVHQDVEILEHQRRWLAIGWSLLLLPNERSNFTNNSLHPVQLPSNSSFQWSIDFSYNKADPEGWVYYDSNWCNPQNYDGFTRFTRSRRWLRDRPS